jgi:hypothetical protein
MKKIVSKKTVAKLPSSKAEKVKKTTGNYILRYTNAFLTCSRS